MAGEESGGGRDKTFRPIRLYLLGSEHEIRMSISDLWFNGSNDRDRIDEKGARLRDTDVVHIALGITKFKKDILDLFCMQQRTRLDLPAKAALHVAGCS